MEWYIVYAKFDGCKTFKAFDVSEGRLVWQLDLCLIDGEYRGDEEETPKTG